jgi:tetratricopeptide (TPR) repeat protein
MATATHTTGDWTGRRIGAACAAILWAIALQVCPAGGAENQDSAAIGGLAKGFRAFYDNEPTTAAAAVERLLASRQPGARLTAAHIKARSLWLRGDPASRSAAQTLWAQVATQAGSDKEALARVAIARNLDLALRGKDAEAVALLESAKQDAMYSSAAPEVAIELALLHAKAGRRDAAEAGLDAATKDLQNAESYGIPKPIADAFASGIRATRASLESAARPLFMRAQGMQREGEFARAIALFGEVSKEFPGTDEDHHSQLEIGSCYVSMNQTPKALEHWKQFTASAPASPWRGQAFVRLMDMALVDRLDLDEATTYAQQAKLAMPAALADAKARPSWQDVGFPVALRVGIVALCRNRGAEAVEAFEKARAFAAKPAMTERLNVLVDAARSNRGVIPEDCRATASAAKPSSAALAKSGDDAEAASLALSLGMIYHLAGQPAQASGFFDRVRGTPALPASRGKPGKPAVRSMAGATPAQLAFAAFGVGAVLQEQNKPAEACAAFRASLKAYPGAAWHDETLYRLGILTDAPADALPVWRQLLEKFPESPRREFALYRCAKALWDHAESMAAKAAGTPTAADAAKVDRAWHDASDALGNLAEEFPDGPYSGEASVKLVDIGLERTFDLEAADAACRDSLTWFKRSPPAAAPLEQAVAMGLPVWAAPMPVTPEESRDSLGFRIYVAAGLVAHLQERNDEAVKMFGEAAKFDKSRRQELGAETSMKRMISVVEGRGPKFSPHDMLTSLKNENQRTGVLLADLALVTFDPERAGSLYQRILAGQPPFGSPSAELEAYLILRMGQALEFQRKHDEAVAMLTRLYEPKYAKYSWASDGIFRLGTWNHNATQKTASAMPHWEHVFTKTPDHPEAERALFYYGINSKRDGEHQRAEKAFRMYLDRYPNSRWTARIRDYELPTLSKTTEKSEK